MHAHLRRTSFMILGAVLVSLLFIAGSASAAGGPVYPPQVGYPNSIASTGDSITRAFNTCSVPFTDCIRNSWSTGYGSAVSSHYNRILAQNPLISGHEHNDAHTGAMMQALNNQVNKVVSQKVDYVTILMGANDACTDTVDQMTPVATYRSQLETALQTLSTGLPNARIYIVSIPNVYMLWDILHDNLLADSVWSTFNICQSMLANPRSMSQQDMQRRQTVLQRVEDYNTQLQQACAEYIHCRFDNDAVFNTPFTPSDVNTRDYFHPNIAGQNLLASVSYDASFNFTDMTAPVSTATVTSVQGGHNVSITATDSDDPVSGIEYLVTGGKLTRYTGPVFVPTGSSITYRAVDSNGNIEGTHTITP
jgi:lysophospholipase L1-like esterase